MRDSSLLLKGVLLLSLVVFNGCGDDDGGSNGDGPEATGKIPAANQMTGTIQGWLDAWNDTFHSDPMTDVVAVRINEMGPVTTSNMATIIADMSSLQTYIPNGDTNLPETVSAAPLSSYSGDVAMIQALLVDAATENVAVGQTYFRIDWAMGNANFISHLTVNADGTPGYGTMLSNISLGAAEADGSGEVMVQKAGVDSCRDWIARTSVTCLWLWGSERGHASVEARWSCDCPEESSGSMDGRGQDGETQDCEAGAVVCSESHSMSLGSATTLCRDELVDVPNGTQARKLKLAATCATVYGDINFKAMPGSGAVSLEVEISGIGSHVFRQNEFLVNCGGDTCPVSAGTPSPR